MNIDNFFDFFLRHYTKTPDKISLIFFPETSNPKVFTFKDVYKRVSSLQSQLKKANIKKGSRGVMLSKLDENFYFLSLSLIALGATPVFLEAKKEKFLSRLSSTKFDAILTDPTISFLKYIIPNLWFKTVFSFGKKKAWIKNLAVTSSEEKVTTEKMNASDPLIISFTTGSTGDQKAADRNYSVSYHQHIISMKHWIHTPNDVDLTFFPNIIFQNLSSGVTTLVPKMRVQSLSSFPFEKVPDIIKEYNVTRLSIPPGYLNALCERTQKSIDSVEKVICGGAAVDPFLAQKTLKLFPNAECNVVYGSTEAEPISSFDMKQLLGKSEINVGVPIEDIKVKIDCKTGESTGEVLISGPHVVKQYLNGSIDNSVFKVKDDDGVIWHRTGDAGHFNLKGELILCGRKKHAFQTKKGTIYSLEVEILVSSKLPDNSRCALFKKGSQIFLSIESKESDLYKKNLIKEAAKGVLKEYFENFTILLNEKLPVDSRHHWKIDYTGLSKQL